jgi:SnoaL-like polyketide cyclase
MSDIIERQREIVATHIRGENEHNWATVYDTFVPDDRAHYDVVPLGAVFKGIEGVHGFYQSIAAALPDLHIEVLSEHDVPGCSIREVVISGTHKGEFAGVKPLGNPIRIEMAAFYTFDAASGEAHRREDLLRSGKRCGSDARKAKVGGSSIARCNFSNTTVRVR